MRSAGACPPHCLTAARDRPAPYGNRKPLSVVRDRLSPNGTKKRQHTVARGPVPRTDRRWRGTGPRPTVIENRFLSFGLASSRTGQDQAILPYREGPWRHHKHLSFGIARSRTGQKKRHPTVARGPVPRVACRWRGTGPRPTVIGNRSLSVVRECLIANGSRSGDLDLQGGGPESVVRDRQIPNGSCKEQPRAQQAR